MRASSEILIYIDVQKAMDAGIKFYLSSNGVVLSEGDDDGYIQPYFFKRVETPDGQPVEDWEPPSAPVRPVTKSALMANAILEPISTPESTTRTADINEPADPTKEASTATPTADFDESPDPAEDIQKRTQAMVL